MNTEASHRFERGSDYEIAGIANYIASAMIAKIAGGEVLAGMIDVKTPRTAPAPIQFRPNRYKVLTGLTSELEGAADTLRALGLEVSLDGLFRSVWINSWRYDLAIEED
jgi:phenylalanyl-tRNA synthetase beta chain